VCVCVCVVSLPDYLIATDASVEWDEDDGDRKNDTHEVEDRKEHTQSFDDELVPTTTTSESAAPLVGTSELPSHIKEFLQDGGGSDSESERVSNGLDTVSPFAEESRSAVASSLVESDPSDVSGSFLFFERSRLFFS